MTANKAAGDVGAPDDAIEGTSHTDAILLDLITLATGAVDDLERLVLRDDSNAQIFPFLDLPPEIQRLIFAYFLSTTDDDMQDGLEGSNQFDFRILDICQKIRSEAWSYFCTSQKFVQFAMVFPKCHSWGIPPLRTLATAERTELLENVVFTIRIGYGCGLRKLPSEARQDVRRLFAWTMPNWTKFCYVLNSSTQRQGIMGMSIDINQRYHTSYHSLVPQVLSYLALLPPAHRVRFTMMTRESLFSRISERLLDSKVGFRQWHDYAKGITDEVRYWMASNYPQTASGLGKLGMQIIGRALHQCRTSRSTTHGYNAHQIHTPDENALESLLTELRIVSANASLAVFSRARTQAVSLIRLSQLSDDTLQETAATRQWTGLSSAQRHETHYLQAKVLWTMLHLVRDTARDNPQLTQDTRFVFGREWKAMAIAIAHELHYALDLGGNHDEEARELLRTMAADEEYSEYANSRGPFTQYQLPGYGVWRGDNQVCSHIITGIPPEPARARYAALQRQEFHITSDSTLDARKIQCGLNTWSGSPGILRLMLS